MAEHGHHDPGGHELEAINTKLLFRLLISLSIVTILASMAVVQWFYRQRAELEQQYAAEGSYMLAEYKTKMGADLEGIEQVVASMVENPALLKAPPAPAGWIHPDDLVGGSAEAQAPAQEEPAQEEPTAPEPTPEGQAAEDGDAEPAEQPVEDEKPAEDKPSEGSDN